MIPDSEVHGANMGPTWVLSVPNGPHVGPMNVAIRDNEYNKAFFTDVKFLFSFSKQIREGSVNWKQDWIHELVIISHEYLWAINILMTWLDIYSHLWKGREINPHKFDDNNDMRKIIFIQRRMFICD